MIWWRWPIYNLKVKIWLQRNSNQTIEYNVIALCIKDLLVSKYLWKIGFPLLMFLFKCYYNLIVFLTYFEYLFHILVIKIH